MSKKKNTANQVGKPESKLAETVKKDADYKAVKREFDEKKLKEERAERKAQRRKDALAATAVALITGLLVGLGAWAINHGNMSPDSRAKTADLPDALVTSVSPKFIEVEEEEALEPILTATFNMAGEPFVYEVYEGDDISAEALKNELGQYVKAGKDAEIVFNKDKDEYEISPEEVDVCIDFDAVSKFLGGLIKGGFKAVDNTASKTTIYSTVVTADSLKEECDTLNDDYHFGTVAYVWEGVSEEETRENLTVTGAMKKAWTLPDGGYDEAAAKEWIAGVAEKYDTYKKPKKFITHDGKEVTLEDSSYGWQIDQAKSLKELMTALKEKDNQILDFSYSNEAYGHENGTDYGKTYVEVDISGQHVYYYKNGELTLDSDCVTGDAKRKRDTDPGAWAIFYMQRNRTLIGPGYASFVYYWMNFNHGEGLHDATWRKASEFGGETYKGNGSHGCVNLPKEWAAQMYEEAYIGMPVMVY